MTLFNTSQPTMQELLNICDFYPEGCYFFWNGSDQLPESSLMLFRHYGSALDVCKGCRVRDCKVRLAPNPNLQK